LNCGQGNRYSVESLQRYNVKTLKRYIGGAPTIAAAATIKRFRDSEQFSKEISG
jgi:hypothetical protein